MRLTCDRGGVDDPPSLASDCRISHCSPLGTISTCTLGRQRSGNLYNLSLVIVDRVGWLSV